MKIFIVNSDFNSAFSIKRVLRRYNEKFDIVCFDSSEYLISFLDGGVSVPDVLIVNVLFSSMINGVEIVDKLVSSYDFRGKIVFISGINDVNGILDVLVSQYPECSKCSVVNEKLGYGWLGNVVEAVKA